MQPPPSPRHPWPDLPPVPPGHYRVGWIVDLPKVEYDGPAGAAAEAYGLASEAGAVVNVFSVLDGDTGTITDHDCGA